MNQIPREDWVKYVRNDLKKRAPSATIALRERLEALIIEKGADRQKVIDYYNLQTMLLINQHQAEHAINILERR